MVGFADPTAAAALEEKLKGAGANYEMYSYPGVGHGFMNTKSDAPQITPEKTAQTGFPPTNDATKDLAWGRLFDFFNKNLK